MLKLQEFIKENDNWEILLTQKPYCIKIQEDEHFILFKYSQISSDFGLALVRECRGIILDKSDWSIACHPFHKFGNYGEGYVPEIDWESAVVQEKLDGSLIKCWFNKYTAMWQWSTNGTIDVKTADLMITVDGINHFGLLILRTLMASGNLDITSKMQADYTFLFELCTPLNKVVVPHSEFKLYHLGTKHNETGKEVEYDLAMLQPKIYPFTNLKECVDSANELPFKEEGYVVVDKNLNRVKIKSPAYLAVHHLKGEGVVSERKALDLIRANEHTEFLSYYEEYKLIFDRLEAQYKVLLEMLDIEFNEAFLRVKDDRKLFAGWAIKYCIIPAMCFNLYDGKITKVFDFVEKMASEKLLPYFEKITVPNFSGVIGGELDV